MGRTYPSEINRILYKPGGDVGKEIRSVSLEIAAESSRTARLVFGRNPNDQPRTGNMARSYQVKVVPGSNTFTVTNPKKYAAAMEKGASPHIIRARRTSVLRFRGRNGQWRQVKLVRHPGSVGRNVLAVSARVVVRRRYGVG